jgi:Asp-tRNA(Asn)/Glu-tRNA(Gln) amidotransferase A subunit family amidase
VPAPYSELGAAAITQLIRERRLSCVEVSSLASREIEARDPEVHAFTATAGRAALERAAELDNLPPEQAARLPLLGVPVAVKDIFATARLPTEYGSPIYRGYQPRADATLVVLLLAAGAIVIGKTKTSELAFMEPTDTRNPLDPSRTPGGSSSGSAAAVAARMAPLSVGTQTAGSVIRPASYCGIVGFKPTFGVVPLAGALPVSATLDTAGLFARSVEDVELAFAAASAAPAGLAGERSSRPAGPAAEQRARLRFGFAQIGWDHLDLEARSAVSDVVELISRDADVEEVTMPFDDLVRAQLTIQRVETAASLGAEADWHGELVSELLRSYIAAGREVSDEDYLAARRLADEERWRFDDRIRGLDAVIAPSTLGVPPEGLESTGDPLLCRPFTLLGCPALALPGAWTPAGLPIGIQLVGAQHADHRLLAAAAQLEAALRKSGAAVARVVA